VGGRFAELALREVHEQNFLLGEYIVEPDAADPLANDVAADGVVQEAAELRVSGSRIRRGCFPGDSYAPLYLVSL
jgi:hypothetical protein